MKNISLKDIAEKAGVSQTAVSKVLNELPIRITPAKREKIKEIARRLNYRPNVVAQSLRSRKTKSIGIVVPDISSLFYPELIRNIETRLFSLGYRCIICNTQDNPSYERLYIQDLIDRWVEGLIIAPCGEEENVNFLQDIYKMGLPLVLIDRYFPGENFPYVVSDNKQGAKIAVKFLVSQKVSRVIYVGEKRRNQAVDDRLRGVKEAARENRIVFTDKEIFLCEIGREKVRETFRFIFESMSRKGLSCSGIFFESNRLLMGLLDAARERNLFIPDDLRIIGFDPLSLEIVYPQDFASLRLLKNPFPIIKQDVQKIGNTASEFLLALLKGKKEKNLRKKVRVKMVWR